MRLIEMPNIKRKQERVLVERNKTKSSYLLIGKIIKFQKTLKKEGREGNLLNFGKDLHFSFSDAPSHIRNMFPILNSIVWSTNFINIGTRTFWKCRK
jgi:hypothetical protein